eukprot:Gregarina_sp_Poly_1__4806@NODE_255_length_10547_cov_146_368416_g222_i0_p9_GENE_NODE_255_length_10547_cov_146_368416_g222_i0NODE_255_length_10547_cov_146_368416_g222_i0_p9_ORF_typecomplete_len121_score2_78FeS/PF04060_13/0_051_NODE_255_length_10547_cov_146_368416_g222_i057786140
MVTRRNGEERGTNSGSVNFLLESEFVGSPQEPSSLATVDNSGRGEYGRVSESSLTTSSGAHVSYKAMQSSVMSFATSHTRIRLRSSLCSGFVGVNCFSCIFATCEPYANTLSGRTVVAFW